MSGLVLSLCDYTTAMVHPWVEAGYRAVCFDTQHPEGTTKVSDRLWVAGQDIRELTLGQDIIEQTVFVAAFPPCTHLAGSGARWWADKGPEALEEALALVHTCRRVAESTSAPWFIENPVGRLTRHWRKWDHTFHPYEYGGYEGGEDDGYTKKTCLWTGGGFVMPEKKPISLADDHDRIHKAAPGPERANFRSATPKGFARAVFEAHHD